MKKPAQTPAPPTAAGKKKMPLPPVANKNLNAQNRRVLAQHYRAKYGVK